MEFNIVRGKFITVDKLDALVSANGLSLSALIDGATRKIEELNDIGRELTEDAQDYLKKSFECQDEANKVIEDKKKIQEAVNSVKETQNVN